MIKDDFSDTFYQQWEQYHKEILEKLELIRKIMKETNEEVCRIQCKTPEGHRINLKKSRVHARKIKKRGPKSPLDNYIVSLLD